MFSSYISGFVHRPKQAMNQRALNWRNILDTYERERERNRMWARGILRSAQLTSVIHQHIRATAALVLYVLETSLNLAGVRKVSSMVFNINLMFCFSDKQELETDQGGRHENKKKIINRRCGLINRGYHQSTDSQLSF